MTGAGPATAMFRALPKAELHLHLEGAVQEGLLCRLSRASTGRHAAIRRLYQFTGFGGFVRAYAGICGLLRRPEHWREVVVELGRRLRRERVLHAEVFFSAAVHLKNGIPYADLTDALEDGARRVEKTGGPTILFLADGVRQWGVAAFRSMVGAVLRHPSPRVVGVGIGGDESALPSSRFAVAMRAARDAGLAGVVHSGELGGPATIRDTLRCLRPRRIAHGVRAVDDVVLLRELSRRGIVLDVCLTSNRRTGAIPRSAEPPLLRLLAAGVRVSLGTDDPALFRCTLSGEYARAARLGVGAAGLVRIAVEGARGSLLPDRARSRLTGVIRTAWTAAARRGRLSGATREPGE